MKLHALSGGQSVGSESLFLCALHHMTLFLCTQLINLMLLWFDDCRPDGAKKAYVRLTTDYDALDVANKIGII